MMETDIPNLISTLGFPIVVCGWLLIKEARQLKALTKAIENLTILIKSRIK